MTQAQAAYEVLTAAGYRCFIGSKPHNKHIVSVFSTKQKAIIHELIVKFHNPQFQISKLKGKDVIMLHFQKPNDPISPFGQPYVHTGGYDA